MKTPILKKKLFNGCAFILLLVVVCSCSNAYFDRPQPVNARNLKKIPKELRGIWTERISSMVKDPIITDSIIINKMIYIHIQHYDEKTEKSEMDTIKTYRITKHRIYYKDVQMNNIYKNGFDYIFKNDTFYMKGRYIRNYYCLSDSVILRKANESFVCNVKRGNWWEIFVLRKEENGEIGIYYPEGYLLEKDQLKYRIQLLDSVKYENEDKLLFHAAFDDNFFDKTITENRFIEPLFRSQIVLYPDSTFVFHEK